MQVSVAFGQQNMLSPVPHTWPLGQHPPLMQVWPVGHPPHTLPQQVVTPSGQQVAVSPVPQQVVLQQVEPQQVSVVFGQQVVLGSVPQMVLPDGQQVVLKDVHVPEQHVWRAGTLLGPQHV
jgi:hypothetical protein